MKRVARSLTDRRARGCFLLADPGAVLVDRQHVVQDLRADPVRHQHLRAEARSPGRTTPASGPRRAFRSGSATALVTALVVTAITTVIASLGGYAVARLRFPGRESVASLILILYLIPPALLFIPLYRVLAELGATNHLSVALPVLPDLHRALLHLAPHRLLQGAARRARGSRPDRRRQPHSPRSSACCCRWPPRASSPRPSSPSRCRGTSSSTPSSSSRTRQSLTVPVGLNLLIYGDVFHWGQLMAASVITTVPVVALYVFIHRWMVEGWRRAR